MHTFFVSDCAHFTQNLNNYVFCYKCDKIYAGDDVTAIIASHPDHDQSTGIPFDGLFVLPDFITANEEEMLMSGIDSCTWVTSQSGRRKQVSI